RLGDVFGVGPLLDLADRADAQLLQGLMVELAAIVLAHCGPRPDPAHIVKLLVNSLVSARGLSTLVPSEHTAKAVIPRSTPTTGPATLAGSGRTTSTVSATYQRSASLRQVADRIRPRNLLVASFVL